VRAAADPAKETRVPSNSASSSPQRHRAASPRSYLTAEVLHGDWLDSGDLGFVHDSELFLCGRHKEIVIVRGANHAPQDFEAALDGLSGVRSGCAVAVGFAPADGDEEALAMLVETTSDAPHAGARRGVAGPGAHRHPARACGVTGTWDVAQDHQWKAATTRGAHPLARGHAVSADEVHRDEAGAAGDQRRSLARASEFVAARSEQADGRISATARQHGYRSA
jgi:acyl-CoA synthetase (AMP-forming)/AMP-acid ligase II